MMTSMDYALHLTPVSAVHYTVSLNSVGPTICSEVSLFPSAII